eukprot:11766072-Alexandrium_andersonii.AAC.1
MFSPSSSPPPSSSFFLRRGHRREAQDDPGAEVGLARRRAGRPRACTLPSRAKARAELLTP